jgi:hypothetical protein
MEDQRHEQSDMPGLAISTCGLSSEVSTKTSQTNTRPLTWHQFMATLEPSFALLRRMKDDQHRTDTENELTLQNQLDRSWKRIIDLANRVQKSEADKTSLAMQVRELERSLRKAADDKMVLESRLQELEKAQPAKKRKTTDKASPKKGKIQPTTELRRPEDDGKAWSKTQEEWNTMIIEDQRRFSHIGRIEETDDGGVLNDPCTRCKESGKWCLIYTPEARAKYKGGWACSQCRYLNQKCSIVARAKDLTAAAAVSS